VNTCSLFLRDPTLLTMPYDVRSPASLAVVREFIAAIDGSFPEINSSNISELTLLCDEFGFQALKEKLTEFSSKCVFIDSDLRIMIQTLEDQLLQVQRQLCALSHRRPDPICADSSSTAEVAKRLSKLESEFARFCQRDFSRLEKQNQEILKANKALTEKVHSLELELSKSQQKSEELNSSIAILDGQFNHARQELVTAREQNRQLFELYRGLHELKGGDAQKPQGFGSLPVEVAHSLRDLSLRPVFFQVTRAGALDGIISYLTKLHGGNVHDRKAVAVTASSQGSGDPKFVTDFGSWRTFSTANDQNAWICYDFGRARVRPTHYVIRGAPAGKDGNQNLRTWVVEGSANGESWIELDSRRDNSELMEPNAAAIFQMAKTDEARLVRLRQTGKNHFGDHHLALCGFDLYGVLHEP